MPVTEPEYVTHLRGFPSLNRQVYRIPGQEGKVGKRTSPSVMWFISGSTKSRMAVNMPSNVWESVPKHIPASENI